MNLSAGCVIKGAFEQVLNSKAPAFSYGRGVLPSDGGDLEKIAVKVNGMFIYDGKVAMS